MQRDSFVFYRSFLEACELLPEEEQSNYMFVVTKYGLDGIVVDEILESNNTLKALFALIKPQIDANNKKFIDGMKGGRPKQKKTSGSKNKKPVVIEDKNQWFSEKKPNDNDNEDVNANVNVYVNDANGSNKEVFEANADRLVGILLGE